MNDRHERPPSVFFSASDWLGGCATLPPMAEWVYLQISAYCMDKGEAVPGARLPMILVRHGGNWQADLDLLVDIGKVIKTAGESYFVKRALIEYERAENAISKKRKAGKQGAQKRWNSEGFDSSAKKSDGNANGTANGDATENRCLPNATRQEQSRADIDHLSDDTMGAGARGPDQGDMLDRIKSDVWLAFVEHRLKLKAPLTDRAAAMMRTKLIEIAEEHGHDPNRVLEQSILRGWKGVFPLKDDDTNGRRSGWRFDDER
jgi:hypothetical protein